tara:strand:+ start:18043 stop:21132 length:3090 start_codon:yes stop_codon:yes gene_type:complete
MSVFKKINSDDVSITAFNAHKDYSINSHNYSGSSCGYGVQILSANYHSWSFGDAINGKPLNQEETNPNGTYKSLIYDSIKHLYYSRVDKPSENFGGNNPDKEERHLQEAAHVISIPSPIYDLKIKPETLEFTDQYIETLAIDRERFLPTPNTTLYTTPPAIASNWEFESSQSRYTDAMNLSPLRDARLGTAPGTMVITSSDAKVGTGSMLFKVQNTTKIAGVVYNTGNGLLLRDSYLFRGMTNNNWYGSAGTNSDNGMPAYTVTMWVKPPDWNKMPNKVTGAPGQSTLLTRDKNAYFELNMLTSSISESTINPKGLVPLQMFWGATGSNCTTSASSEAVSSGFGLATGSWNLVSLTQEFWPEAFAGTTGSQTQELPPWGHSPAKTTLRIYRPDPAEKSGYSYIKKIGYATASRAQPHWSGLLTRAVTSSIQYSRNMFIGASGSRPQGALNNNPDSTTLRNAFTGSIDDIRFYESTLTEAQVANLYKHPALDLTRTPPVTASFNLTDDGYGNIRDTNILTSSFANPKNLVGYYGFNELYTVTNKISMSADYALHNGFTCTKIQDSSTNKNTALSKKVKFVPGIASMAQSGSVYTADAINFYQTDVNTGLRAQFNNSGSIQIPHHTDLNLAGETGFAISFWIKIPENQIPGVNTITGTTAYLTTGGGGSAGGTSTPCINVHSGSSAGRDYVSLIGKLGLGSKLVRNSATGEFFQEPVQGGSMNTTYPYHIQLKNTSYERHGLPFDATGAECINGAPLNTLVLRRSNGRHTTILESNTPLTPLIDNHVVIQGSSIGQISIWINGKQDTINNEKMLDCTDNISNVFIGDQGTSWATGSNISYKTPYPQTPFSGSIDELRFYKNALSEPEILSLYDNDLNSPTAYQTNVVGNVFYEHGIVALTNTHFPKYFSGSLHTGTAVVGNNSKALFSDQFQLKLQNTRELYEQKIKCHTRASDFNLTTNPTARRTTLTPCNDILSVQELAEFAKDPAFNPYVTTIGLYDDFGRLLAIAKLARPVQKLQNVDMTFIVKFDR